jgi:uncharacterized protein
MGERLRRATSPYLRQHADNPVDWYPWGDEAFAAARERDVPVLVSIGYAACHWCHVMAHESFDDPDVAAMMNSRFVNVKVDREERPDVDAVYMQAVQALTGSGGWPLTVVTTPAGEPWFGGTYFPPDDRFGRPGFTKVLTALSRTWRERRDEVVASAAQITEHVARHAAGLGDGPSPGEAAGVAALAALRRQEDRTFGGFGGAPKFPPHTALRWLLEHAPDDGAEPTPLALAGRTLAAMVRGGIFDQLGGGFARYAVDASWTVPHFEKMLYDNALLLPLVAEAGTRLGDERLSEAARRTLAFMLRELRLADGTFASSLDADSEGSEGRYYTWTPDELAAALGDADDERLARALYGVHETGQLEGRSVLTFRGADDPAVVAALGADGVHPQRAAARVEALRARLLAAREARVRPALDDKVVTSWNGLAVWGLARGGGYLGSADASAALSAAERCADVVWQRAFDGRTLRHLAPERGGDDAVALLEDASFLGLGLLELHRATGAPRHLQRALDLAAGIAGDFVDPAGGFFTRRRDDPQLVVRGKSVLDGPTPSEHGAASELLALAAAWTGDDGARQLAEDGLSGAEALAAQHPTAVASMLSASAVLRAPPREVVVAGHPDDPQTASLLALARAEAPRHALIARAAPELAERVPHLRGKAASAGRATAYACAAGVCHAPTSDPAELRRQLARWKEEATP